MYADRVEPAELVLRAGSAVSVQIVNLGQRACRFVVRGYPGTLDVPGGERMELTFTVPSPPSFLGPFSTSAGCEGDPARTGRLIIRS